VPHGITPRSVSRAIEESLSLEGASRHEAEAVLQETAGSLDLTQSIAEIEEEMLAAANNLEFETAAVLRDQVRELKRMMSGGMGEQKLAGPKAATCRKVKRRR